jgi:hypothetical protein
MKRPSKLECFILLSLSNVVKNFAVEAGAYLNLATCSPLGPGLIRQVLSLWIFHPNAVFVSKARIITRANTIP